MRILRRISPRLHLPCMGALALILLGIDLCCGLGSCFGLLLSFAGTTCAGTQRSGCGPAAGCCSAPETPGHCYQPSQSGWRPQGWGCQLRRLAQLLALQRAWSPLDGSTAGELIPELVRHALQQLIELEVVAVLGAELLVDEVGRRPYAPRSASAAAIVMGTAA